MLDDNETYNQNEKMWTAEKGYDPDDLKDDDRYPLPARGWNIHIIYDLKSLLKIIYLH